MGVPESLVYPKSTGKLDSHHLPTKFGHFGYAAMSPCSNYPAVLSLKATAKAAEPPSLSIGRSSNFWDFQILCIYLDNHPEVDGIWTCHKVITGMGISLNKCIFDYIILLNVYVVCDGMCLPFPFFVASSLPQYQR